MVINRYETEVSSFFMNQERKKLTVILPVRYMDGRNILERLSYPVQDDFLLERANVSFLVVDDGSSKNHSIRIKEEAIKLGFQYIYIDSSHKPFSIARARNIGARYAVSQYIMFIDVDLLPYDGFYRDLIHEIEVQDLNSFANDFIMIGVVYLTYQGGEDFFSIKKALRRSSAINWLLMNDTGRIDKFSTGTSVCLYNRSVYMANGGNNEAFEQWGYEDLEFNLRLIRRSKKFPLPKRICDDYRSFKEIVEFVGWKSIYRLYGDMTFQKGFAMFHIWHEVDESTAYIEDGRKKNRCLFNKLCASYANTLETLPPLADPYKGRTLLFSKTNPFVYNRDVLPKLGEIFYKEEESFNARDFLTFIKDNKIDRVLFHNPYATKHRLSLYQAVKNNNIDFIIAERGALRNSVFFDKSGFNADSRSYDAKNWDRALSKSEIKVVESYISEEKSTFESLEYQVNFKLPECIRIELGLNSSQKILFVPLQRPSDTVIQYFCGGIETYDKFIALVNEVAIKLPSDWVVVVKKHPLEDDTPMLNNVIFSNENVKSLIEISESVLLINSGVGLLSMLWEKPVLYAGDVFYGDVRLNTKVLSALDVIEAINAPLEINKKIMYRFIHFLIEDFYSFGNFHTKEVPWKGGGRMTVTQNIDFYQIRNIDDERLNLYIDDRPRVSTDSILFDRYQHALESKAKKVRVFGRLSKRYKKFKEMPDRFFLESKFSFFRFLGRTFFN